MTGELRLRRAGRGSGLHRRKSIWAVGSGAGRNRREGVARLEHLTEAQLNEIAQEIRDIKEDLATLSKKQAKRSVGGLLWKLVQFGVDVGDIVELWNRVGSNLLPPG